MRFATLCVEVYRHRLKLMATRYAWGFPLRRGRRVIDEKTQKFSPRKVGNVFDDDVVQPKSLKGDFRFFSGTMQELG